MGKWLAFTSRYRIVSGVLFLLFFALTVSDVGRIIYRVFFSDIGYPFFPRYAAAYGALALGFAVITAGREQKYSVHALVLLTSATSYLMILLHPTDNMTAEVLLVGAAAIAYRYKLLDRRPRAILAALFGGLIVVRVLTIPHLYHWIFARLLNQVAISATIVGFLYWTFENEIIRSRREREVFRRELETTAPFAQFGRNAAGIVHDFKNDAALFASMASLARQSEGEPLTPLFAEQLERAARRLSDRISTILRITAMDHQPADTPQLFNLREMLEASIYVFRADIEIRHFVSVDLEGVSGNTMVHGSAAEFVAIIENILRNSCDAVEERQKRAREDEPWRPRVTLVATDHTITVKDNGGGLPFCPDGCRSDNCLFCPSVQMGNTTKEHGTGIGLFRVGASSEKLGIPVLMRTSPGEGVTTTITIPHELRTGDAPS